MATEKQNRTKKNKFDMEATVNSKQQFTGPKATEGSVGDYVNNVRASKDYYDKQERKKQTGSIMSNLGPAGKAKKNKKKLLTADEFFKIKDSKKQFTGPKSTKSSLGDKINKFRNIDDNMVIKMKKGGSVKKKKSSRKAVKGGGCEIR